jgi:hypothetical protein
LKKNEDLTKAKNTATNKDKVTPSQSHNIPTAYNQTNDDLFGDIETKTKPDNSKISSKLSEKKTLPSTSLSSNYIVEMVIIILR